MCPVRISKRGDLFKTPSGYSESSRAWTVWMKTWDGYISLGDGSGGHDALGGFKPDTQVVRFYGHLVED